MKFPFLTLKLPPRSPSWTFTNTNCKIACVVGNRMCGRKGGERAGTKNQIIPITNPGFVTTSIPAAKKAKTPSPTPLSDKGIHELGILDYQKRNQQQKDDKKKNKILEKLMRQGIVLKYCSSKVASIITHYYCYYCYYCCPCFNLNWESWFGGSFLAETPKPKRPHSTNTQPNPNQTDK